jgi:hypothetical protein
MWPFGIIGVRYFPVTLSVVKCAHVFTACFSLVVQYNLLQSCSPRRGEGIVPCAIVCVFITAVPIAKLFVCVFITVRVCMFITAVPMFITTAT